MSEGDVRSTTFEAGGRTEGREMTTARAVDVMLIALRHVPIPKRAVDELRGVYATGESREDPLYRERDDQS